MYEEEFISDCHRDRYQEVFKRFDKNNDELLSAKELQSALTSLGHKITEEECINLHKNIPKSKENKIKFEEFLTIIGKISVKTTDIDEELYNSFRAFDKDGNGFISGAELKHLLMNIGDKLKEEEVDELINCAELDENGNINYIDFIQNMLMFKN